MVVMELSEKALMLVEKRRGERTVDQYINMILENISDRMATPQVASTVNLFDLLETKNPEVSVGTKILEIIKQMRTIYPGKIPYNIFFQECAERGISNDEIEKVVYKNRGLFQFQQDKDDEYSKVLLIIIYNYLKDFYSKSMSTSQFYGKCLEECLTVDDIRFAENTWQISIPDVSTIRDMAAKTDSMSVENKLLKLLYSLKKEHPDTVPTAVLHTSCLQQGFTRDDIVQLEKIYTRYLLTKHNDRISSEKGAKGENGEKKDMESIKAKIKETNARIKKLIDELASTCGENIPPAVFLQKCKETGFTGEEQLYAKRVFDEYLEALASFKEIKYMNNKAYIILNSLRKVYPGKIPYNIFYNKCKAIGLKNEEISDAIKQSGKIISTEKNDEEHLLKVLDNILTEVVSTRPTA